MDESQCRCCLEELSNEAFNLLDDNYGILLKEQLKAATGVEISESDTLGKWICTICFELINSSYTFKKRCLESDRTLKGLERRLQKTLSERMKSEAPSILFEDSTGADQLTETIDDDFNEFMEYEALEESHANATEYCVEEMSDIDVVNEELIEFDEVSGNQEAIFNQITELDDGTVSYSCSLCQYVFEDADNDENAEIARKIQQHAVNHSHGKHHVCMICSDLFMNRQNLTTHEYKQHFLCKCQMRFETIDEINLHKEKICNIKRKPPRVQKSAAKELTSKKHFKCYICNETFKRGIFKKAHINNVHADKIGADCPLCVRCKIPSAIAFENHYKTHFTDPQFACANCSQKFYESDRLQIHVKRFHSLLNFACDICGKSFRDKCGITRHVSGVHLNKRDFVCPLCTKSFTANYNLKEHMFSVHNDSSQSYNCKKCSQNFLYRKQFERHYVKCDGTRRRKR